MLALDRVGKTYPNGVHALERFSAEIQLGEIVAIIGGSGCGKSTLLRAIAGLDRATSGTVTLDDISITAPHAKIGIIFQEPRLLPWLSVADNIGFGLSDLTASVRREKVARALARVGLTEKADAWPRELSGGQAQRVAIARALVPQPEISQNLDSLANRIMTPVVYQNRNGSESLWADHTVMLNFPGGPSAIRWYQFDVTGGKFPVTPVQQQDWSNGNDGLWRWMPSIAVDQNGNAAIGYSTSSENIFPSIRYAGRLATDPLNYLSQGEAIMTDGHGSQDGFFGRWGDYTMTTIDPADGITFWHTNEYCATTSSGEWSTRVGKFRLANPQSTLENTSARTFVQRGDNVMIGGFMIEGTEPKRVIIRAIGPELTQYGVPDALANPTLELHDGTGALIASNNNWVTTIIGGIITSNQVHEIQASGYAPGNSFESAIIADLPAGNYTAIVRGENNLTGVALVEVYNLDQ